MKKNNKVLRALFCAFIFSYTATAESSNNSSIKDYYENYTYNEFNFRVIDQTLLNMNANKHFIIAGDSNVFGDGCKEEDTLAALLSKDLKDFYVYNWGLQGGGPHDSLYLIEFRNALKLIKEKEGVLVYNFFPFLFERTIGSKNYLKWSRKSSPYYQLNENESVSYSGTFEDRFFITSFYKFINKYKWLDSLLPKLPQIHRRHIKLVAHIFKKIGGIYKATFPKGKFVVFINNSYDQDPAHLWQNKQLEIYLKELGVNYKVINSVVSFKGKYTFPDGHITPEGQRIQAEFYKKILE